MQNKAYRATIAKDGSTATSQIGVKPFTISEIYNSLVMMSFDLGRSQNRSLPSDIICDCRLGFGCHCLAHHGVSVYSGSFSQSCEGAKK